MSEPSTPREQRDAYEAGYRDGESSLLADVNTLCDQLGIDVDDLHAFEAIRRAVDRLRTRKVFVVIEFTGTPAAVDGAIVQGAFSTRDAAEARIAALTTSRRGPDWFAVEECVLDA